MVNYRNDNREYKKVVTKRVGEKQSVREIREYNKKNANKSIAKEL